MAYPITGSTLNSKISTGLSTQIIIKCGTETVGAIQSLSAKQNRPLERVKELGLDGTLEIVPRSLTEVTLDVKRVVFDQLSLSEAFARGFINIKSQRIPFEILVIDRTAGDDSLAVINNYINCWFTSMNVDYNADNYIIMQNASLWAEDVSTTRNSENAAQGGARGINYQKEERERDTDKGKYRGTMDASGIINAAFSN